MMAHGDVDEEERVLLLQDASFVELYASEVKKVTWKGFNKGKLLLKQLYELVKRITMFFFQITFCCLNICCCCWVLDCIKKNKISEDEKGRFIRLSSRVKKPYHAENPTEERLLKHLFETVFGSKESLKLPENLLSEKWTTLGFQTSDPRKDFRGGGLLALTNILSFVETYKSTFEEMVEYTKRDLFVFACNSIRVTVFLRRYFNFDNFDYKEGEDWGQTREKNRSKNLCRFLSTGADGKEIHESELSHEEAYTALHHILLREVFFAWKRMLNENPHLTIFQISQAEINAEGRFSTLIEQRIFKRIEDFEAAFRDSRDLQISEARVQRIKQMIH